MIPAVVSVALLIRLAYLMIAHQIGISPIVGDSPGYIEIASSLVAGDGFQAANGTPTAWRVPVYPLFLAGLYAILGTDPNVVGIIHAVLGALTAGIVAAIAWRLAGPVAGWAAGLLVALYPHLITWTPYVLSEIPFIFFAMLALWLLIESQARDNVWWFAWAGLALTIGALTRTMLLPFVPVAAATAWWLTSGRERWVRAGAVLLAPVVLITLWIIRNALIVGSVTLSTQAPIAIWWGNNPDLGSYHRGGYASEPPLPLSVPPSATEVEQASIYMQAVRTYLAAEPLSVVQHMPLRVWNMWRPAFEGSSARGLLVLGGSYLVVLVLGLVGFALTIRNPPQLGVRYVQGYVVSFALFHALVIGEIRYRMPIEPALAILGGIAVGYVASLLPFAKQSNNRLPRSSPEKATHMSG